MLKMPVSNFIKMSTILKLVLSCIITLGIISKVSGNLISSSSTSEGGKVVRHLSNVDYDFEDDDDRGKRGLKPTFVKLPENYSLHNPPPLIDGKAVPVQFSVLVFNVFDIKELQGDLSLEINLKVSWKDTRLANWTANIESGEKYTVLSPSLLTKIWHPDVFIDHMKGMTQPALISKPASLRIYPDGSLRYSARMLVMMSCRMDFYYYPADTQKCNLDIKSYGFSTKHIVLSWKDSLGAVMAYPVYVHNFDVALDTAPDFLQQTKSSNYSGISFSIYLRRKLSYHIIQTFIPSALFTIVSWLSFLVPPESTPGRMAICVTTLLTLTAMFGAVRQNTPSVSYIKALDLWMVTCIVFVFSVLVEYTVVLKLRSMTDDKAKDKRKDKLRRDGILNTGNNGMRTMSVSSSESSPTFGKASNVNVNMLVGSTYHDDKTVADPLLSSRPITPAVVQPVDGNEKKPSIYFSLACKIERYVPRFMPITFIIFCCFYWPYLLIMSDYYMLRDDGGMYYSL